MKYFILLLAISSVVPLSADIFSDAPGNPDARAFQIGGENVEDDVLALDNQSFDAFIKQDFVVVKFYAEWCAPCRRFGAKFASVANELSDIGAFAKLNISTSQPIAAKWKVKSVPTIVIFSQGVEVKRHLGSLSEEGLRAFILAESFTTDR